MIAACTTRQSESPTGQAVQTVRLAELVGGLSYALDLTEGLPPGHATRCCWIGMHIAKEIQLPEQQFSDLYYTLLLKDAGCSSNAARVFELYANDDRAIKRDYASVNNRSFVALAKFVIGHLAPEAPLVEKLRRFALLAMRGEKIQSDLVAARCQRGSDIALEMGFSPETAAAIEALGEYWDGRGRPRGLKGTDIPMNSRIALLAQVVEVFWSLGGPQEALACAQERSGTWFDPNLVRALQLAAAKPGFWQHLASRELSTRVARLEPVNRVIIADEARCDVIARAFARVIDAKSPFTFGHSTRVARYADAIARQLGMQPKNRRWLRRAALLHDIGKLGISNALLDKPGKLTPAEYAKIKEHSRLSGEILCRIPLFREFADIGRSHHERLDGKGYPLGLQGEQINLETRIVTVADIFDALTAERPYRGALPVREALALMAKDRGIALDPECLDALHAVLPSLNV
ncbi:MAG: HD domain-containing protein [Phycisphaerales bacterium]|nr:HD domain-containing protein [Phycisphaerales bacterium]